MSTALEHKSFAITLQMTANYGAVLWDLGGNENPVSAALPYLVSRR